jgi:hypothetical protein
MTYEEKELYLNCDMLALDLSGVHRAKLELQNDKLRIDIKNLRKVKMNALKELWMNFTAIDWLVMIMIISFIVGLIVGKFLKTVKTKVFRGNLRIK